MVDEFSFIPDTTLQMKMFSKLEYAVQILVMINSHDK